VGSHHAESLLDTQVKGVAHAPGNVPTKGADHSGLEKPRTENRTEVTKNRTDRFRFLTRFQDLRNRNNLG
jgi:hypothetical protein